MVSVTGYLRKRCEGLPNTVPSALNTKEGNVLFNDALNTFYLRLYGVGHMVKDYTDNDRKPAAVTTWATLFD